MSSATISTPAEGDYLFDGWFDPIEAGLRTRVRGFIETLLEEELTAVLSRPRYGRQADEPVGRSMALASLVTGMVIACGT